MTGNLDSAGVWTAILIMAVVTVGIRVGGFFLMGYVPLTRRVRRMLNALPGAVVAAVILPLAVRGGVPAIAAIAAALGVMIVRRNDLLAVVCGVAVAAALRAAVL